MNELAVEWRKNKPYPSKAMSVEGPFPRASPYWLDFVIDGEALHEIVKAGDLLGSLGWGSPEWNAEHTRRLLGDEPSWLATGRFELYVCPNCGDIGCGAITATIQQSTESVLWRDFAYELDYDLDDQGRLVHPEGYEHIGPFEFDLANYRGILENLPLKPTQ